jgi:hypothetical protein
VEIVGGKPRLRIAASGAAEAEEDVDYVVLAVPGPTLAELVMTGARGDRIVDRAPRLAGLQRFQNVAIPVVDVYFHGKVEGIPKEQVGFRDSVFDLTLLDISQLWTGDPNMKDRTAVVLAASDAYAMPSLDPLERGFMMIRRLHDYLPCFEPGQHWGDPKSDIDWSKTHFRSNDANKLFINDVGSWESRPKAVEPGVPNVFFAGDFCQTDVDMATVEAAVQRGLLAAKALQAQDAEATGKMRGEPITIAKHEVYSPTTFVAAKLALLPLAYAATAWSALVETLEGRKEPLPADAYSPLSNALILPLAFTEDWLKTAYWLVRNLAADVGSARLGMTTCEDDGEAAVGDAPINVREQALDALGDMFHAISARQPSRGETGSNLSSALSAFSQQFVRTAQVAWEQVQAGRGPQPSAEGYRRRWRANR